MRLVLFLFSEIKMFMEAAARVECCRTVWARRFTLQILLYGKFVTAGSAEHSFLAKVFFGPNLMIAAACSLVAFETWKIFAAAIKFYRDAVDFRMIVKTAGFCINVDSFY